MNDIVFLKSALFILFFLLCACAYGINEVWKKVERLEKDNQDAFDYLGSENTEREIDIRMLCDHIGADYDVDIKGKSDWYLSDVREG